jgi:hypothetical protein
VITATELEKMKMAIKRKKAEKIMLDGQQETELFNF